MSKTMKEMCQEALDVQDACNLSGVVHAFSRLLPDLRALLEYELGKKFSTEKLNQHPVCILFADKIEALAVRNYDSIGFSQAYTFCSEVVDRKTQCAVCGKMKYLHRNDDGTLYCPKEDGIVYEPYNE